MNADSTPRKVCSGQVRLFRLLTSDLPPPHLGRHVGRLSGSYAEFQVSPHIRYVPALAWSRNVKTHYNNTCSLCLLRYAGGQTAYEVYRPCQSMI